MDECAGLGSLETVSTESSSSEAMAWPVGTRAVVRRRESCALSCWGKSPRLWSCLAISAFLGQALIKLIQATKNPVICICNVWSPRHWHAFRARAIGRFGML